jgi:hypothetical protein
VSYEIDEITDFVDGGRKSLKISPRANPVVVYGGTWKLLLDNGLQELTGMLLRGELTAKDMGVLLSLTETMGMGNRISETQAQLAKRIESHQSVVSRSVVKLKELDLIREDMVSPLVVVKGRTEDYPHVLATWNRLAKTERLSFGKQESKA